MIRPGDVLKNKIIKRDTRNTYEFQAYGNRLSEELNDKEHRALYIRLAKTEDRNLLERAREHAVASDVSTKGKIFMWKLGQLKVEKKNKTQAQNEAKVSPVA